LRPIVKLLQRFGVNPHFYTMHIAIDNAVSGHGYMAKQAILEYLDLVRQRGGDEAVQQQWKRIWNGYVAFQTVGTLGDDLANLLQHPPSLKSQMIDMIQRKAPYGSQNHGDKKLGGKLINEWFANPEGFLQALRDSGNIVPGNPNDSPILHKTTFDGPMYKVFTDSELELWKKYIRSLVPTDVKPVLNSALAMKALITRLGYQQKGNPAHDIILLTGYDDNGKEVVRHLSWWFTQPPVLMMQALTHKATDLIVLKDIHQSKFVTVVLAKHNAMTEAFDEVAPDTGGRTYRQVLIWWIEDGCPNPSTMSKNSLKLESVRGAFASHHLGKILGNGACH